MLTRFARVNSFAQHATNKAFTIKHVPLATDRPEHGLGAACRRRLAAMGAIG